MNFYSGIIILLTFQNFEEHLKEKRFYLLYTSYEYRCQNTKAIICIPLQRVYWFSIGYYDFSQIANSEEDVSNPI